MSSAVRRRRAGCNDIDAAQYPAKAENTATKAMTATAHFIGRFKRASIISYEIAWKDVSRFRGSRDADEPGATPKYFLRAGGRVVAYAKVPGKDSESGAGYAYQRYEDSEVMEISASEKASARIKRGKSEGHDPNEKKLDVAGINGKWVAAEHQQVPERRVNANAVFKPKKKSAEEKEKRYVNKFTANTEEK